MSEAKLETAGGSAEASRATLSREELWLAYAAMFILVAAIAFTVGAILA